MVVLNNAATPKWLCPDIREQASFCYCNCISMSDKQRAISIPYLFIYVTTELLSTPRFVNL